MASAAAPLGAAVAAAQQPRAVVIVGSGPAAQTAGIYTGRAALRPLLFEGNASQPVAAGGQLTTTTDIENFPGFPAGIGGTELTERFAEQARRFGTEIVSETVTRVDLSRRPFAVWIEGQPADAPPHVLAHSLIIATGATSRKLEVPGSSKYWQKGISTCATCDGALPAFRKRPVAVVGGGDSACEEAAYLSKFASEVLLIHRRDKLRASKVMAERALGNPKIRFIPESVITEVVGNDKHMTALRLRNVHTGAESEVEARGLFLALGHEPATRFLDGQLELDAQGYVVTRHGGQTSVEGVFAAGDVQDSEFRQAITAAGSGCMAALKAERWLEAQGILVAPPVAASAAQLEATAAAAVADTAVAAEGGEVARMGS